MFTLPDQYVQLDGIRTRYWDTGEGPVVLLLHGLSEHVELWHLTIPSLLPHFRVVALDCLGHGLTDKPLDVSYDIDQLTEFVIKFMDQVDIEKAHMVGHSLGGAIAAKLTISNPERVDSLVLQDAAMLGKEIGLVLRLMSIPFMGEILLSQFKTDDFSKFEASWRDGLANSSRVTSEFIQVVWKMLMQPNFDKVYFRIVRQHGNLLGIKELKYKPILEGLTRVNHPTLVVWGNQDDLVPVSHAENAVELLPNARLKIIEECGHAPCLERPDHFNKILLEFLLAEQDVSSSDSNKTPAGA